MSKIFVVICILIIMVLFVVSCILMTTVNPPPLENINSSTENLLVESKRRSESNDLPTNPWESLTPFYRFNPAFLSAGLNGTFSVKENEPLFYFPLDVIKNVIPPLYPLSFIPTTTTTTQEVITTRITNIEDIFKVSESLEDNIMPDAVTSLNSDFMSSPTPEKGFRRSINNYLNKVIDGNSGSVVMKILNKHGQSRIEIKINTDQSSETQEGLLKDGPDLEMVVKKEGSRYERGDLSYNTEIKILQNNTIIVDSNNDRFLNSDNMVEKSIIQKQSKIKLGNNTKIEQLTNGTDFINTHDNKLLAGESVLTRGIIKEESKITHKFSKYKDFSDNGKYITTETSEVKSKTTNVSPDLTFTTKHSKNDDGNDGQKITKDKLSIKYMIKPNTHIGNTLMDKSDPVMSTVLDLKNSTDYQIAPTSNMHNNTRSNNLQLRSIIKGEAKTNMTNKKSNDTILLSNLNISFGHRDNLTININNETKDSIIEHRSINKNVEHSNLRIVKEAENNSSGLKKEITEKNISIKMENLYNTTFGMKNISIEAANKNKAQFTIVKIQRNPASINKTNNNFNVHNATILKKESIDTQLAQVPPKLRIHTI